MALHTFVNATNPLSVKNRHVKRDTGFYEKTQFNSFKRGANGLVGIWKLPGNLNLHVNVQQDIYIEKFYLGWNFSLPLATFFSSSVL